MNTGLKRKFIIFQISTCFSETGRETSTHSTFSSQFEFPSTIRHPPSAEIKEERPEFCLPVVFPAMDPEQSEPECRIRSKSRSACETPQNSNLISRLTGVRLRYRDGSAVDDPGASAIHRTIHYVGNSLGKSTESRLLAHLRFNWESREERK